MAMLRRLVHRYRVDLTALLVVSIWGVSAPFRKAALAEFDVLPFTALRFLGLLALGWSVFGWHCHITGTRRRLARADISRLARLSPELEAAHQVPYNRGPWCSTAFPGRNRSPTA